MLRYSVLDLNLSITNGIVPSKIYDKRDDFNFETVNFLFLDGDVPRSPSYGVYEPRSDKRDLLAIKVKSEISTEKERPSCCEQLQKI